MNNARLIYHIVAPYQSLHDILRIYDIPLYAVVELNPDICVYNIACGDRIAVLDYATHSAKKTHIIQKGETFYSIMNKYSLDFKTLLSANTNLYPKDFILGKTIVIPEFSC